MKPNCTSRQLYKGVLSDKATAVFNGRVRVHPGAHGSDGAQTNRNLLLSPGAVVDTKPELEIDNDDVRCTHGATVGQLDPQELFYLHSRGIDPDAARIILSRAFVDEVLLRAPSNRWTEKLSAACASFFDGGQAS
jgi:Fe-S cluster assembly protein SufD